MKRVLLTGVAIGSFFLVSALARAEEPTGEAQASAPAAAEMHQPSDEAAAGEHAGAAPAEHEHPGHLGEHEAAAATGEHAQAEHGEHAHGEHGGEHAAFSVKTFAFQLLNFGVLLFILIWFGGRAMNKSLRARHEQLKADIESATRQRDEARRAFDAQEQRVASLEKEVAALRASMRTEAEREQAALLVSAQERARKIKDEMRFQMDQQVKQAEAVLRAEVAAASVKLAEEMVKKVVSNEDERRLAREFVASVDGSDGSGEVVR